MSTFSNTDTGSKPADLYTHANKETAASTQDKIAALDKFVTACKFGMMTTRDQATGKLVSRCMAVTAEVVSPPRFHLAEDAHYVDSRTRRATASIISSSPTPSPTRRTS